MCGIFGYIGNKDPIQTCLEGLKQLEYRGYDSSGIAGIQKNQLLVIKEVGKISELEKKLETFKCNFSLAIGHTRWATHGEPSTLNAHPHTDEKNTVAVIHNGIIENCDALREMLIQNGVKFRTATDTEVIAQLIAFNYKNNLQEAVSKTIKMLKGSLGLAIIHQNHPEQIITVSREMPLAIGFDDTKENIYISSDPNVFIGKNLNIFYLRNDEISTLSKNHIQTFDSHMSPIEKATEKLSFENFSISKNGFDHYMLKEIYEEPNIIQALINQHALMEFGTADFSQELSFTPQELMAKKHILIIACGTSWHAGLIASSMLEDIARIPTQAEIASEMRFRNLIINEDTLVIAISQSGETADTIQAVREAKAKGAKILGICNVKNSTLTRESHSTIFLKAGPEISVCSTKAFTSQITILTLFTLYMARLRHLSKEDGQKFLSELKKIPQKMNQILVKAEEIQLLADKYAPFDSFYFIGRRYMYTSCLEAALKLKEISYLNATAYPAGELKHGPIALLNKKLAVVALCANKQTEDKMVSNLMEVKARKSPLFVIAGENFTSVKEIANDHLLIPETTDELAIFTTSLVCQLFAYYIAKKRGTDIDQPRNLAKSVTVE
jgi:glucosamine--fructose-6-phosphate aminotransferase (isomerizing)